MPLFNSELAPVEIRGRLITFNQIAMTGGIMVPARATTRDPTPEPPTQTWAFQVAFWVNYALQHYEYGWRYALAGQCIPAFILLVGCLWMPRSPRWLVQQGLRVPDEGQKWIEEARRTLLMLREGSLEGS